jgi:hypothetical protein
MRLMSIEKKRKVNLKIDQIKKKSKHKKNDNKQQTNLKR